MKPCVRCAWPRTAHTDYFRENIPYDPPCHRYERPAPWWLNALNALAKRLPS